MHKTLRERLFRLFLNDNAEDLAQEWSDEPACLMFLGKENPVIIGLDDKPWANRKLRRFLDWAEQTEASKAE